MIASPRATACLLVLMLWAGVAWLEPLRADEEPKTLPPREDVTLATEDEMVLKATFWPGAAGKESVPVIMLHMFGGNRQDYNGLAEFLQGRGCAVMAVDLRGHGDSTHFRDSSQSIVATNMPPAAFSGMLDDVEAVKKFLMDKNNAGELNIDKLCLVGAEMGAIVAANWAVVDWDWPPLAVGKQGQDVKALVLLSPPEKFKLLRMLDMLNDRAVRSSVAVYIAVGNQDASALREATKIYTTLKKHHPDQGRDKAQDLYFDGRVATKLQGTKLLRKEFKEYNLQENIAEFIELRAGKQPFVWQNRKLP